MIHSTQNECTYDSHYVTEPVCRDVICLIVSAQISAPLAEKFKA